MPEPGTRDFVPRVRQMLGTIDYYLHDLNRGIARIQNGQVPDGSGDPLPGSITVPNDVGAVLFVGPGPVLAADGSHFFWNDTNHRLGLNTSPDATLHIFQEVVAPVTTDEWANGWGVIDGLGGVNAPVALLTNDGDTTFIQGVDSTAGGTAGEEITFWLPTNVVFTGWKIHFIAKQVLAGTIPNDTITVFVDRTYSPHTYSGGTYSFNLGTNWLRDQVQGNVSYADYVYNISATDAAAMAAATTRISILLTSNGSTGSGNALERITQIYIETPGDGGGDPLQKWEYAGGSNLLEYGTGKLQLTGTPHLQIATSGLEFNIGSPAANKFWVATDTEGTGAWTALSSITPAEFVDSAFRIIGSATSTKKLAFEVDGFTAATTRTLTPQDSSYIIAGTNIAQTFTAAQTIAPSSDVVPLFLNVANVATTNYLTVNDSVADLLTVDGPAATTPGNLNVTSLTIHNTSIGSGNAVTFSTNLLSAVRTATFPDVAGTVAVRTSGARTIGRVPFYSTTTGNLSDDSDMSFATDTLTITKIVSSGGITSYKGVSTVRAGVTSLVATSTLTAQSAAIGATTIYAVPAAGAGMYRISWVASITTAATTSCILGGANSFQVTYTDPTDSVVKTSNPTTTTAHTSAVNATATTVSGVVLAKCKLSTNLQYAFDYTSVGVTAMVYDLDIAVEFLG
jgi:hypothetical protein